MPFMIFLVVVLLVACIVLTMVVVSYATSENDVRAYLEGQHPTVASTQGPLMSKLIAFGSWERAAGSLDIGPLTNQVAELGKRISELEDTLESIAEVCRPVMESEDEDEVEVEEEIAMDAEEKRRQIDDKLAIDTAAMANEM